MCLDICDTELEQRRRVAHTILYRMTRAVPYASIKSNPSRKVWEKPRNWYRVRLRTLTFTDDPSPISTLQQYRNSTDNGKQVQLLYSMVTGSHGSSVDAKNILRFGQSLRGSSTLVDPGLSGSQPDFYQSLKSIYTSLSRQTSVANHQYKLNYHELFKRAHNKRYCTRDPCAHIRHPTIFRPGMTILHSQTSTILMCTDEATATSRLQRRQICPNDQFQWQYQQ